MYIKYSIISTFIGISDFDINVKYNSLSYFINKTSQMLEEERSEFEEYVKSLLVTKKGERIYKFQYANQFYWLKQPEQLRGIWKVLKPHPSLAFQRELKKLQFLMEKKAPIPKLVFWGKDFFVLEDGGEAASHLIGNNSYSIDDVNRMLVDIVDAILSLHKQELIHGRPAIRDIIWNNGKVLFIDFESQNLKQDIFYQKRRDIFIFLYTLGREKMLSNEQILLVINEFQRKLSKDMWQSIISFIYKRRWIYYLLVLFKFVAHTDLKAIYRLFEIILYIKNN